MRSQKYDYQMQVQSTTAKCYCEVQSADVKLEGGKASARARYDCDAQFQSTKCEVQSASVKSEKRLPSASAKYDCKVQL